MSSESIRSTTTFYPQGKSSINQEKIGNMGIETAKYDTFVSPHNAQQSQQRISKPISDLLFESGIGPFGTKNRVARIGLCKSSPSSPLEGLGKGTSYRKVSDISELRPGDAIRCFRPPHGVTPAYHHYAIYLGHGEAIGYDRDDLGLLEGKARIRFQDMDRFQAGPEPIEVVCSPPPFSQDEVCARALANYGRIGRYSFIGENCSDFSDFAYFGKLMNTELRENRSIPTQVATGSVKDAIFSLFRQNDWFSPDKEDQFFSFLGKWTVNAKEEDWQIIKSHMRKHFGKGICPGGAFRLDHDHKHFHHNFQIPDNWGHTSNGEEKEISSLSSEEESSQKEKVKSSPEKKKEETSFSSGNSLDGTHSTTDSNKKEDKNEELRFSDVTGSGAATGGTGLAAWGFGATVSKYGNWFFQANPKSTQEVISSIGKKALQRAGNDATKVGKITGTVSKGTIVVSGIVFTGKVGYYTKKYINHEISGKKFSKEVLCASGSGAGSMVGGSGGAAAGAFIGTMIFPGIGTAIGGVVGGVLGGCAGDAIGDKTIGMGFDAIIKKD